MDIILDVVILMDNLYNIPDKYMDFIVTMNGSAIFVAAFKTVNDIPRIDFIIFSRLVEVWDGLSDEERQPFEDFAHKYKDNDELTIFLQSYEIDEWSDRHMGREQGGVRALRDKYS